MLPWALGHAKGCHRSAASVNTTVLHKDMSKAYQMVRAAPGPGENMTRESLIRQWAAVKKARVLGFDDHGEHGCLSNWYEAPFTFRLPEEFCGINLTPDQRTFWVPFSQAAIMACKAAAMGDKESFIKITTSRGVSQATIRKFGREVRPFSDEIWDDIVFSVAYEVAYQKVSKLPAVQEVLLRTGDCLIAEATCRDKKWGIGLDLRDKRVADPRQWNGTNMHGWALMLVRSKLRESVPLAVADVPKAVEATSLIEVDSSESTEAIARLGIKPAKNTETALGEPTSKTPGNCATNSSRRWRRRMHTKSNNA